MHDDPILDGLNEAQRDAVTHEGSPLLVVAGAGSGKTRVITRRIAWRIRAGLLPWRTLAITFTNKAAGEMRERVASLVGDSRVWLSTFHALGARFLRMEADAFGVDPNFTIFDAQDQATLLREILKQQGLGGREHRPRDYAAAISSLKNLGELPPEEETGDRELDVYRAYERALEESRALDFDDLLCRTVRGLEADDALRDRLAGRFDTVLIDEYQDTNRIQYRLVRLLVDGHRDVCATGDPDQSIYRWRGADVRNILDFERDFPGTRVVKLEENYRSTNGILKAASVLIAHNTQRVERELWSRLGDGEPIRIAAASTEGDEARQVVQGVERAIADGYGPHEIAVFYRTNASSRAIEQALRDRNLPYVIVGAVEFYERREVKDLLAYLRLLVNPRDVLDLQRVVNVPSRGIGTKSFAALRSHAEATGRPVREVVFDADAIPGLRPAGRRAIRGFAELLEDLLAMPTSPVRPILERVIERIGYRRYLQDADDPLTDERLENVDELVRALHEYDLATPDGSLERFLAETALVRSREADADDEPRITLMTLHAAKGLEYPVVFVTSLEEGILPHSRSMDSDDAIEEERRLLYVGMTRAQRRLSLSYARSRGGYGGSFGGVSIPSRFLTELPEALIEGRLPGRRSLEVVDDSAWFEPEAYDDAPPFEPGDRVIHDRFGVGRVVRLSGFGPTAKVTVDFLEVGQKKLILEYAALRKALGGVE